MASLPQIQSGTIDRKKLTLEPDNVNFHNDGRIIHTSSHEIRNVANIRWFMFFCTIFESVTPNIFVGHNEWIAMYNTQLVCLRTCSASKYNSNRVLLLVMLADLTKYVLQCYFFYYFEIYLLHYRNSQNISALTRCIYRPMFTDQWTCSGVWRFIIYALDAHTPSYCIFYLSNFWGKYFYSSSIYIS